MWVGNSIKWQKWHSCSHSIALQKHKSQKMQGSVQVSLEEPHSPLPTLAAAGDFSIEGDHNITNFVKNLSLWDTSSKMLTLKCLLNSEYQNLTEGASAGLEYSCEIMTITELVQSNIPGQFPWADYFQGAVLVIHLSTFLCQGYRPLKRVSTVKTEEELAQ